MTASDTDNLGENYGEVELEDSTPEEAAQSALENDPASSRVIAVGDIWVAPPAHSNIRIEGDQLIEDVNVDADEDEAPITTEYPEDNYEVNDVEAHESATAPKPVENTEPEAPAARG